MRARTASTRASSTPSAAAMAAGSPVSRPAGHRRPIRCAPIMPIARIGEVERRNCSPRYSRRLGFVAATSSTVRLSSNRNISVRPFASGLRRWPRPDRRFLANSASNGSEPPPAAWSDRASSATRPHPLAVALRRLVRVSGVSTAAVSGRSSRSSNGLRSNSSSMKAVTSIFRELQQLDGLTQLRRHDQRLRLPQIEAGLAMQAERLGCGARCAQTRA